MVAQGIVMEPAVSLSGVQGRQHVKWSPGAIIRARHEGVGLSAMWFKTRARSATSRSATAPRAVRLLQDRAARVTGRRRAGCRTASHELTARAVVLGCGGFEANPEWRARYLGRPWDHAKVRGTRYNTGDGLRMALEIGALPCGQWTGCHSTPIDADAPPHGDRKLTDKTNRLSYPFGVLVNARGRRFFDEGEDFQFYTYAKLGGIILNQPGGIAYQIFDAKVTGPARGALQDRQADRRRHAEGAGRPARRSTRRTRLRRSRSTTPRCRAAPSIPTVKDGLATRGLELPKSNWAQRLDTPPFVAYPVTGGITFTFGGVKINERAQVHEHGLEADRRALRVRRDGRRALPRQLSGRDRPDVGRRLRSHRRRQRRGRVMRPTTALRALLKGDGIVVAPGVYDGLSARLARAPASPPSTRPAAASRAAWAIPTWACCRCSEMVDRVANIVEHAGVPVIADADTGYGNALNVRRAVREFERAGVAALHLEDQDVPEALRPLRRQGRGADRGDGPEAPRRSRRRPTPISC